MRDVWMIQCGERLRFAREPREPVRIVGEGIRKDFERDIAIEPGVARTKHLSHPADADAGDDFIGAEARAWDKGQR